MVRYISNISTCREYTKYRGGPFDTWGGGGAIVFLIDQTFSTPSKFFRLYHKQTIFFSAVEYKTIFSSFNSFDSPYT